MKITTDASIFEIEPLNVLSPKNTSDLVTTIRTLLSKNQAFTVRAGGTSIGGQAIGAGVIVDVSKHLNNILQFSKDEREVVVEPGVIQDDLNTFLQDSGLRFAPDTSTSNRAMIGGMIGNNSCGSYSIFYGTTRDHVKSVRVILSDGSLVEFKELSDIELDEKMLLNSLEGEIYRFVINLLRKNRKEILDAFPDESLIRRNTGYALDELIRKYKPFNSNGKGFNLSALICGSEGTLGVVIDATLNLVKQPKHKSLMVAQFKSDEQALNLVNTLVKLRPSAIEYIDKPTLDASKNNTEQRKNRTWISGEPKSVLIIEFFSESLGYLDRTVSECRSVLLSNGAYSAELINKDCIDKVWNIRKAGLGLLMGKVGPKKSVAVIEDAAVPIKDLYAYYKEIKALMHSYNVNAVYYGHVSVGLIHVRPELDLSSDGDREKMHGIAGRVSKIVKQYKGSISGEHGDGRIRAPFLREQFGESVYQYLIELKRVFDPNSLLNPEVILSKDDLLKNVRITVPQSEVVTAFDWSDDLSFYYAAEKCNGAGVCRKTTGGIMCPSYRALRSENSSTRGRANLLRRSLSLQDPIRSLKNNELKTALSFCLSCKACKNECPANVNMSRLRSEYLFQTRSIGSYISSWHIRNLGGILNIGSKAPGIFNFLQESTIAKWLHGYESRSMPLLNGESLDTWWKTYEPKKRNNHKITIHVLVDLTTKHYDTSVGKSVFNFLRMCDVNIRATFLACSVSAMISHGLLNKAKKEIVKLRRKLINSSNNEIIVGIEPSEVLVWRDEAKDLVQGELPTVLLFDELLLQLDELSVLPQFHPLPEKVWAYEHCHQKSLPGSGSLQRALGLIPELRVEVIDTGCCGMAGDFGYKHNKISEKIAHQSLDEYVVKILSRDILITTGTSCKKQTMDIFSIRSKHISQLFIQAVN